VALTASLLIFHHQAIASKLILTGFRLLRTSLVKVRLTNIRQFAAQLTPLEVQQCLDLVPGDTLPGTRIESFVSEEYLLSDQGAGPIVFTNIVSPGENIGYFV